MSHIYQIIQHEPSPCFTCFADTVLDARREGDVHPDKTIIADTMTLIGNRAYGKCATEKTKHRDVVFCNEEVASRGINSHRVRQLEPIAESVYQLTGEVRRGKHKDNMCTQSSHYPSCIEHRMQAIVGYG